MCKMLLPFGHEDVDGRLKISNLWDNIPTHLKDLNTLNFSKHLKVYLLSEQ